MHSGAFFFIDCGLCYSVLPAVLFDNQEIILDGQTSVTQGLLSFRPHTPATLGGKEKATY